MTKTLLPKVGSRVRVKSLNIKGTIFYIDKPNLYQHHMYPIQIELDKPYDDSGQRMYRTSLTDMIKLKKKVTTDVKPKKKKKKPSFDDEVFSF